MIHDIPLCTQCSLFLVIYIVNIVAFTFIDKVPAGFRFVCLISECSCVQVNLINVRKFNSLFNLKHDYFFLLANLIFAWKKVGKASLFAENMKLIDFYVKNFLIASKVIILL